MHFASSRGRACGRIALDTLVRCADMVAESAAEPVGAERHAQWHLVPIIDIVRRRGRLRQRVGPAADIDASPERLDVVDPTLGKSERFAIERTVRRLVPVPHKLHRSR